MTIRILVPPLPALNRWYCEPLQGAIAQPVWPSPHRHDPARTMLARKSRFAIASLPDREAQTLW